MLPHSFLLKVQKLRNGAPGFSISGLLHRAFAGRFVVTVRLMHPFAN
jgi:hypothetical protein